MKNSIFLSLIFVLGLNFIPSIKSMDNNEIQANQEVSSNIDNMIANTGLKMMDLAKEFPRTTCSIVAIAVLPFALKKVSNSNVLSGFLAKNVPMVGCMVQSGYDLTVGLFDDLANFGSGVKDLIKLNLELQLNLDRQKRLSSQNVPPAANDMLSDYEMYNRRSVQSELTNCKARERAILKEIKDAKNKASVSQIGYRILRGGLAGLAGYQLFLKSK